MPFADPERRRAYQRERRRLQRAAGEGKPSRLSLPTPLRLETAASVLALLEEQVNAVRTDPSLGTLERARCLGSLAGIALRAVETADLEARLETLEHVLRSRGTPL